MSPLDPRHERGLARIGTTVAAARLVRELPFRVPGNACHADAIGRRPEIPRLQLPVRGSESCGGPTDHINTRISHSGSKAQYERDARNHGLQDPYAYVAL